MKDVDVKDVDVKDVDVKDVDVLFSVGLESFGGKKIYCTLSRSIGPELRTLGYSDFLVSLNL